MFNQIGKKSPRNLFFSISEYENYFRVMDCSFLIVYFPFPCNLENKSYLGSGEFQFYIVYLYCLCNELIT